MRKKLPPTPQALDGFSYLASFIVNMNVFSNLIFLLQPGSSISKGVLHAINKDADRSSRVVAASSESVKRPPKLMKLDDGRSASLLAGGLNVSNANESALPNVFGAGLLPGKPVHKSEDVYHSEKQISEVMPEPLVTAILNMLIYLSSSLFFMPWIVCSLNRILLCR